MIPVAVEPTVVRTVVRVTASNQDRETCLHKPKDINYTLYQVVNRHTISRGMLSPCPLQKGLFQEGEGGVAPVRVGGSGNPGAVEPTGVRTGVRGTASKQDRIACRQRRCVYIIAYRIGGITAYCCFAKWGQWEVGNKMKLAQVSAQRGSAVCSLRQFLSRINVY